MPDCIECEGCGACDKELEDEGVNHQTFNDLLNNDGHLKLEDEDNE